MANGETTTKTSSAVIIPAARINALTRALVWSAPAGLLGAVAVSLYGALDFSPSGLRNRLIEYSLAVCALPFVLFALWSAFQAIRWLLLALWPGQIGFWATPFELSWRLGPFGSAGFDTRELTVRYLFEIDAEPEEDMVEAFLPEEVQRATLLPMISHAGAQEPIQRTVLRFSALSESEAAKKLGALLAHWQGLEGRATPVNKEDDR